jgi:hypothetical protein
VRKLVSRLLVIFLLLANCQNDKVHFSDAIHPLATPIKILVWNEIDGDAEYQIHPAGNFTVSDVSGERNYQGTKLLFNEVSKSLSPLQGIEGNNSVEKPTWGKLLECRTLCTDGGSIFIFWDLNEFDKSEAPPFYKVSIYYRGCLSPENTAAFDRFDRAIGLMKDAEANHSAKPMDNKSE